MLALISQGTIQHLTLHSNCKNNKTGHSSPHSPKKISLWNSVLKMGACIRDPLKMVFRMESAKSLAQLATFIVEILTWAWRKVTEVTASPTEKDMKDNSKITLCGARGNTFSWTAILMRAILGETSVSDVEGTLMEIKKIWNWVDLRGSIQQTWEKEGEYWYMIRLRWRVSGKMGFMNSLSIPIRLNDFLYHPIVPQ